MRILLDENLPHKLRALLTGHEAVTVAYLRWTGIRNGRLIDAAEAEGFEVLITSDQGIPFEQNLSGRKLAILVVPTPDWNVLKLAAVQMLAAIATATPGSLRRIEL